MSDTSWSKQKVLEVLREESTDGIAPSAGHRSDLYYWAKKRFGTWKAACEAADVRPRSEKWTKQRVIQKLREASDDGVAPKTQDHEGLANVARELFDSWEHACSEAGVRARRTSWDRERVIETIQSNAEDGYAPSLLDFPKLYNVVYNYFDSYKDACRAAGVKPRSEKRTNWSKQKIIEQLKEHSEGEYAPSCEEQPALYGAVGRYFESWEEACEEAGLQPRSTFQKRSPDALLQELQERAEEGVAPSTTECPTLSSAVKRHFESWEEACEQAGLVTKKEDFTWTREELLEKLQDASINGVAPSSKKFKHTDSVQHHFDSWEEACELAGLEPMKQKKWTKERILTELKRDAEAGVAPSSGDVKYTSAARREFGSWRAACKAAGIKSRNMVRDVDDSKYRKWTRKTLINKLQEDAEDGVAPSTDSVTYHNAAIGMFGSWHEACRAAGLKTRNEHRR